MSAVLLFPILAGSQTDETTPLAIENEPHHTLAFENDRVRVFHLQLQPNEATKTHRHSSFYAYFSLQSVTISNEVVGHAPVITQLEAGELRTSKGGFDVAERNKSDERADIFVVLPLRSSGEGFATPVANRMHDTMIAEQYTGPTMRVYLLGIASGGRLEEHTEAYDSLVIALVDSSIRETAPGKPPADWEMKAGEARWIPRGTTHSETNNGPTPADLMVFEFN
jgi:quercetin dioxygenase-like cupin family protein